MLDVGIKQNYTTGEISSVNILTAEEINSAINEIESVIVSEGITLDGTVITQLNQAINKKVQDSYNLLDSKKMDNSTVYSISEINVLLATKADNIDIYTKTQIDSFLSTRTTFDDVYTKTQTDTLLNAKADVTNVFTKSEIITQLALKASVADVYTKAEVDSMISNTEPGVY